MKTTSIYSDAVTLLKQLIETQSFSREEVDTAALLKEFWNELSIPYEEKGFNIWVKNKFFSSDKPSILLNSHHDTVKPNKDWTKDPFVALEEDEKLFGLGSNDAGGALVSLMATFRYFYDRADLPFNLIMAATAEEEISGKNGIASIWDDLGEIDLAIVGEPTEMHLAIAEKGLMVIDMTAKGKSGHAARDEGVNAISIAMKDIQWFHSYHFAQESDYLGPVKMSVTVINAGTQHNVVPSECHFTVDVRTTDAYSNEETLEIIKTHVKSEANARSTRLNPSSISADHPIVKAGLEMGRETFGSPTLSDQSLMPVQSLKMGPGRSQRSHQADEFIYLKEIEEGIQIYTELLERYAHTH
ncbi:M20 family metallo-hydrolase [Sediminitomix flava]|nr:M20 family metallo-hydrolase [Sediminitomix flava]